MQNIAAVLSTTYSAEKNQITLSIHLVFHLENSEFFFNVYSGIKEM